MDLSRVARGAGVSVVKTALEAARAVEAVLEPRGLPFWVRWLWNHFVFNGSKPGRILGRTGLPDNKVLLFA